MNPLLKRNKQIVADRKAGVLIRELSARYNLSEEMIMRITVPKRVSTFSVEDFHTIRKLVEKYSLKGVILEVARIAGNYGGNSAMWRACATRLRLAAASQNERGVKHVKPQSQAQAV